METNDTYNSNYNGPIVENWKQGAEIAGPKQHYL